MPRNVHVSQLSKSSKYRLERKRRRLMIELDYSSDSSNEQDTEESIADGSPYESDDERAVEEVLNPAELLNDEDENVVEEIHVSDGEDSIDVEWSEEDVDSQFRSNDRFSDEETVNSGESSHESDDSDEEPARSISDQKLYEGATITVAESFVMILQFFLTAKLSNSDLSMLLSLITSHLPKANKSIKSLYFFKKWLADTDCNLVKHYFCDMCFDQLMTETDECAECEGSNIAYFIEIPLESQLRELFARPGFYNSLAYRFNRSQENHDLEDIYDGDLYKRYCSDSGNFDLSSQSQISFMWNMDGVPLFKSSKTGIWPLFLKINELPPALRNKYSNILMTGLWFGTTKPNANLFMRPLRDSMKEMAHGISIKVHDLDKDVNIKGLILCGTGDLPAEALALNMVRYNGKFGCHICTIRTKRIARRSVYTKTDDLELRTLRQTQQYAQLAIERGKSVFGVKGPTILAVVTENFIQSTLLDPMHLLSGIAKLLLKLWIREKLLDKNNELIIGNIKTVNARLCSIKPPLLVERTPRSVDDYAYWKASEYIIWLLIYSLPVLNGIMSPDYFSHHQKLVCSLTILYQDCVALESITVAEQLLHDYVAEYKDLYPSKYMTCQLHSLLHLCQNVRDCGPLRIFSCFPFENGNGILKSLLHATRDPQFQLCAAVSSYVQLDSMKSKYLLPGSDAAKYCEHLASKGIHRRKLTHLMNGISIVGSVKKLRSVSRPLIETLDSSGLNGDSVYEFTRLFKRGRVIAAQSYKRVIKTDSSCVEFVHDGIQKVGRVKHFLRISNCSCKSSSCNNCIDEVKTVAIISEFNSFHPFMIDEPRTVLDSIYELRQQRNTHLSAVDISQIHGLLFCIAIGDSLYAAKPITL